MTQHQHLVDILQALAIIAIAISMLLHISRHP